MITSTYGGGYSCHNDYCPKASCNFAVSSGPNPDWWNTEINVRVDGNMWCATYENFINLEESVAGFGITPQVAVDNLRIRHEY
jgi:hypothetical protein